MTVGKEVGDGCTKKVEAVKVAIASARRVLVGSDLEWLVIKVCRLDRD